MDWPQTVFGVMAEDSHSSSSNNNSNNNSIITNKRVNGDEVRKEKTLNKDLRQSSAWIVFSPELSPQALKKHPGDRPTIMEMLHHPWIHTYKRRTSTLVPAVSCTHACNWIVMCCPCARDHSRLLQ